MILKRKGRKYRSTKVYMLWHRIKATCGKIVYSHSIKQNMNARILVVLHLYYMDSWPSIKCYLENLSSYNYDLIVTFTTNHYDSNVLENVREFKNDVRFAEYENRGFDIGSFIDILSQSNLDDYDIVYKLHSKGVNRSFIFIYNQVFKKADWFLNLFDGVLGEFSVHRAVNLLMRNHDCGLVASSNLIIQDPPHKRAFTRAKAAQLCIPVFEKYHFVAGSCFAIKAPLLSRIQDLHLRIDSFEHTQRGVFSLAHAMERIICASVETQGQRLVGIPIPHPIYALERRYRRSISAIRLLEDERFSIDYDYFYKALELHPIFSYKIKLMKLGEIRRYWEGRYYSLRECSPFAYICGDVERYEQYTEVNSGAMAHEMSSERFDKLIKSLEESGFDEKFLPIVCAKDNTIWDGQHRCCWLISKYGEEHIIPVLYLDTNPWYQLPNTDKSQHLFLEKIWRALSYRTNDSCTRKII